ncbi:FAD-binding and (Fe-S)-binding domain-containing protein [Haloactinomyces albus]|uniref:D-lactate dehydrogenase (cytochrome) n=1 Tax=Haloactinomyces albus TaxID=1352928 RepID=A0AAE3ZES2_9ACTN|nr:FAD-binding and (Fe-S)-binding domain-containing protein [Haloactinomyces albus]MDR7303572.1 D-lactate dehydrogenase [Haloactinomyces albus]
MLIHPAPPPTRRAEPLTHVLGDGQVLTSQTDLARYASDASPYRLMPRAVAMPRDSDDVAAVFRFASEHGRRVVLRAAGTSLNGQAQGEDILLDVRRNFEHVSVEDEARIVRAGPGVVLARANVRLFRHDRILGPDPSSAVAACIGGVVANNASGAACGITDNSYRTVESVRAVLPTGTVVDTAAPDADDRLAAAEPELVAELCTIRDELRADTELADRVRSKFAIKNTNGYRLDAFLDEDRPSRILRGLLVGSQGTLGFLDEIVMRTVPRGRMQATAFLRFPDLASAAGAVPALVDLGARAVELMDNLSIRCTRTIEGAPAWMEEIGEDDAALLVECRASDETDLEVFEKAANELLSGVPGCRGTFTRDPEVAHGYWAVRKGLLTALGANRPSGTILLGEDVCVAPRRVAEAIVAISEALQRHGFDSSVAGHAAAGNLHFSMVFDPAAAEDVERYRRCLDEIVDLVLDRFDGSLKGEHGTGRNMAPYVRREWGTRLLEYMRRIKDAVDPAGILGDGVIFTDDPLAHVRDLKTIPSIDPVVDDCIECGFCEPVCPSGDVTTTPRQRIVLGREIARRGTDDGGLRQEHDYAAVDTCAGDSSCAVACPVGIDTGKAMKKYRAARNTPTAERVALALARRWTAVEACTRILLGAARLVSRTVGDRPLQLITRFARRLGGNDLVPEWLPETPGPAKPVRGSGPRPDDAAAVYFTACVNRIFGTPRDRDDTTVTRAVLSLAERAGLQLWLPPDVAGSCCSTVWHSKGFTDAHRHAANDLLERIWEWSDGGRLPVVVDAASCTLGVLNDIPPVLTGVNRERHAALTVVDALSWARSELLPRLSVRRRVERAVLHPTCAMQQLGLSADLSTLTAAISDEVVEPLEATCCGFAGDRGFLHREVTEGATRRESAEVREADADLHLSGNRPCELGLEHATGMPYESALVALDRATRSD